MRGLGDLQVAIMEYCELDEAPRATFAVAAMRERLATDREVLRCDSKTFKLSFRRALEGLVRRQHLTWGDRKRSRVRRGPVAPALSALTRKEAREFRAFILREAAMPPTEEEDVRDYLTDDLEDKDAIEVMRYIARDSQDVGAQLAAIRRLAMYLGADNLHKPPPTTAKWNVIVQAPDGTETIREGPGTTNDVPPAMTPRPRGTSRDRREAYDESGHGVA